MSDILRRARPVNRVIFDPTNDSHIESFKTFLETGSWGDVQFYPEAPYIDVPATVMVRFSRHMLKIQEKMVQNAAIEKNLKCAISDIKKINTFIRT
ncbi:MAG: hypothetical protein DDT31_01120 [Syntrophomonadaceae bacterium]|nr:hypothetical protein [Bacillota bacterium]